jgi:hypothetical protein
MAQQWLKAHQALPIQVQFDEIQPAVNEDISRLCRIIDMEATD